MLRAGCLGLIIVTAGLIAGCADDGKATSAPPVPTAAKGPKPANAAPDQYLVKFETSRGDVVLEINRAWAPLGADQFHQLVKAGFYDNCRFFRVVSGFMVQCGINGDPPTQAKWQDSKIQDDPVVESNKRGTITFAMGGRNTRTTQFFINFADNSRLDPSGFAPFGKVIAGMEVVDALYSGYGEMAEQRGRGPSAGHLAAEGNAYLERDFPKLDYSKKATILPDSERPKATGAEKPGDKPADKPAEKK